MKTNKSQPKASGSRLKKLRIVLALCFFLSVSLVFLDIHGVVSRWLYDWGLYFQFVPSLIYGVRVFGLAATGFMVVLVLTLLFGRIYCASICPLGILMDMVAFLRKNFGKKQRHRFTQPHTAVRYLLLTGTVLSFFSGSMLLINLLDPFSNFGRISVALAKPLVVIGNNCAAYALETVGSYCVPPYPLKGIHAGMIGFTLAFAVLIFYLAFTRGRFYCNLICPVGTLLGLVSKTALVKVRIREDLCNGCGRCERVCKSNCIDIQTGTVDNSRCVACFNCLNVCPTHAVTYRPFAAGTPKAEGGSAKNHATHTRRGFLGLVGASFALLPRISRAETKIKVIVPNKIRVPQKPHPIVPPGGVSLDHFTNTCTACHACVAHCPAHVLQPSLTEYGLTGLFMPHLDPNAGFCNLNCNQCGQVCPTGAITSFCLEEKKQMQLGVVKFIRNNCIVVLQGTDCGACSEHCPTKAVTMVTEGKVRVPRVNENICLGCGACEHVCPAKPHKAIYVKPHTVHQTAETPPANELKKRPASKGIDDFGF